MAIIYKIESNPFANGSHPFDYTQKTQSTKESQPLVQIHSIKFEGHNISERQPFKKQYSHL